MTQTRTQDMAVYPMVMAVRSESDGAKVYEVHLPYCPCADFTNRKGQLSGDGVTICKHIREALERVGGWHREETAPRTALYPALSRGQANTLLLSAGIDAAEVDKLLTAARGARGLRVGYPLSDAEAHVNYDGRMYVVWLPVSAAA